MYCDLSFSGAVFGRLISYRIADLFQPLATPVDYPANAKSWLDGVLVTQVELNALPNDRFVIVNELGADGNVTPNSAGYGFQAGAVTIDLAADVFLARVEDVAAAGLADPPVTTVSIPRGVLHLTVRMSVGSDGIPQLQMQLDPARLAALNLPAAVLAGITAASTMNFPFDIGNELAELFPAGNNRVLNAGITRDDNNALVMRFEFPGEIWQSAIAHANDWQQFFSTGFKANLGTADWAIDLDGSAVASGLAQRINPAFRNEPPISFDGSWIDWGFLNGTPPRVVITKHGRVENACAGNDVRFDVFANIDLSVPSDNLLRGALSFDFSKNDWDVAKCFGLTLLNPVAVFITLVDNGELGAAFGELALSAVLPTRLIILDAALVALLSGADKALAQSILDEHLAGHPLVTRLPEGGFAIEQQTAITTQLTRDWLVLREAVGEDGRLLLRGELRVPPVVLPRVRATDLVGFTKWRLTDRCEPGRGQQTTASVTLDLVPGYSEEALNPPPVRPTIPLKYALRPGGGVLMYEVVDDPLGVYQDAQTEYRQLTVPGIPGVVEALLKEATLRKPAFAAFGVAPYPLRLRFFTNGGVREYVFAAPPIYTEYTETLAQMAERINRCKLQGADLLWRKYLELRWRVDPPPFESVAQLWEIHVHGLAPGRQAHVWNQTTGALLVTGYADATGRLDVALVLPGREWAAGLLLGLDDERFQGQEQLRAQTVQAAPEPSEAAPHLVMQQTVLTELNQLAFAEPVVALQFVRKGGEEALLARTHDGRSSEQAIGAGRRTRQTGRELTPPAFGEEETGPRTHLEWRGGERRFTQVVRAAEEPAVLAEYSARSAYDRAAGTRELFAQASSDGRRVTLFRRGTPLLLSGLQWEEGDSGGQDGEPVSGE